MPKIFRGDFFTRMGPSVAEIFKDEFRQSGTICTWGHLCPEILIGGACYHPCGMGHMCPIFHGGDFFTPNSLGPSVPETKDFT